MKPVVSVTYPCPYLGYLTWEELRFLSCIGAVYYVSGTK